jgi:hypothetical protein
MKNLTTITPEKSSVKVGANQHLSILHRIDSMNNQKQQVADALRELASKSKSNVDLSHIS